MFVLSFVISGSHVLFYICVLPTGVIVNFLPAFGKIKEKSELFDDKLYWEVRQF